MDPAYTEKLLAIVKTAPTRDSSDMQAILHDAYQGIIHGNFDSFGASLTADVELNICGFAPMHGNWRGRKEVVEATKKNFALVDGQQPEVEGMISHGNCIAVLLRESGVVKTTRQAYSIRAVQWFTFADGKIKKIDEIAASIWKTDGL